MKNFSWNNLNELYHGTSSKYSNELLDIEKIQTDFASGNTGGHDFGIGFYLTSNYETARDWAIKTKSRTKKNKNFSQNNYSFLNKIEGPDDENQPIVIKYLLQAEGFRKIKQTKSIKLFPKISRKWAKFVLKNRLDSKKSYPGTHRYAMVQGPIADSGVTAIARKYDSQEGLGNLTNKDYLRIAQKISTNKNISQKNQISMHENSICSIVLTEASLINIEEEN